MLQKLNNPDGIKAIKTFVETTDFSNKLDIFSNGLKMLATTKSRSFVLGHMAKSATKYLTFLSGSVINGGALAIQYPVMRLSVRMLWPLIKLSCLSE